MKHHRFDITPFLTHDEGQHFDRKSLYEGPPRRKRPRNRRAVRDQVAEYVAAFANADGGVLVLGMEDDCSVTGHSLPEQALRSLLSTPSSRLSPPQPDGFIVSVDGKELIVFDVPVADAPVMVAGDGFPLRMGDQTVVTRESHISALKFQNMSESWESRPSPCRLEDLDRDLLARAKAGGGLTAWSDEEYLLKRKLADFRGSKLMLRRAAELMFVRRGPDHPNAGIRIFRVIGKERRTGVHHNVEERPRIETHLPGVLDEARMVVESLLRRPSRLVDGRFREAPEYPDFSWKEAILNAVEHRDYGIEGSGTEVWLFEDRMEVFSSGGLLRGLTLDELISLNRVHQSRNPRIVRALVDLGYARDQGEGLPRMFAEMEDAFLPLPEVKISGQGVTVILRNTPTLTMSDRSFVASLEGVELNREEFRALLQARRHGRVDNRTIRSLTALDTLAASRMLGNLRDRDLLTLQALGSNSYYTLSDAFSKHVVQGDPKADRGKLSADRGKLGTDRGKLPLDLQAAIDSLGVRPRKERIRPVIEAICTLQDWTTPAEIARILRFRQRNLSERHLRPMVNAGRLVRRFPDHPRHPRQAYQATAHRRSRSPTKAGR